MHSVPIICLPCNSKQTWSHPTNNISICEAPSNVSTTEKFPEGRALGCTGAADIIPGEPCISFWGCWFSCCCRKVLRIRSSSPTRRRLAETICHLQKSSSFKEQSRLAQHKRKYHTADATGWSDLRHKVLRFCLALLHLYKDDVAEGPCRR